MSRVDLYLHKNSPVLKNKAGETSFEALDRRERFEINKKSLTLPGVVKDDLFDLERLRKTHAHLYGGLYEFAGKLREGRVEDDFDNSNHYLPPDRIGEVMEDIQSRLMANNWFDDRGPEELKDFHKTFSSVMATTYAEVLRAHPFEEKNELPALVFVTQMAAEAGYKLEWDQITAGKLHNAASDAIKGNVGRLRTMFSNVGRPTDLAVTQYDVKQEALTKSLEKFRSAKTHEIFDSFHQADKDDRVKNYLDQRHIEVKERGHRRTNDNSLG